MNLKMDKIFFNDLQESLKEAAALPRGEIKPGKVTEIPAPDAKSIRSKVGLQRIAPNLFDTKSRLRNLGNFLDNTRNCLITFLRYIGDNYARQI